MSLLIVQYGALATTDPRTDSRHKFASNVVEKAIRHSNTEHRRELVYGLVFYKSEGFHRVPMLLKDSYANFVFQVSFLVLSSRAGRGNS